MLYKPRSLEEGAHYTANSLCLPDDQRHEVRWNFSNCTSVPTSQTSFHSSVLKRQQALHRYNTWRAERPSQWQHPAWCPGERGDLLVTSDTCPRGPASVTRGAG